MRIPAFLMLLLGAASLRGQAAASSVTLSLSEKGELEEVFDSGLEMRHIRGLENTGVEARSVNLRFQLGEFMSPEHFFDDIEARAYKDGKLLYLWAISREKLTLEEARALAKEWSAPSDDLERFLLKVSNHPIGFRGDYLRWELGTKPVMSAGFRPSFNAEEPLYFDVNVGWRREREDSVISREPLKLPAVKVPGLSEKVYREGNDPERTGRGLDRNELIIDGYLSSGLLVMGGGIVVVVLISVYVVRRNRQRRIR
jgi:hypothetical protein